MPKPKNWSGPAVRDARIKTQVEGHVAHNGFITDRELDNCRDLDTPLWDTAYNQNNNY